MAEEDRRSGKRASVLRLFRGGRPRRVQTGPLESSELAQKVFTSIPEGIVVSRIADGRVVDVNASFCRLSGWTREELLGRTVLDLKLWAEIPERDAYLDRLRRHGRVEGLEATFQTRSGERRTIILSSELLDHDEDILVLAIARDITRIRRTKDQLERQNVLLHALINSPGELVIFALDAEGRYTAFNERHRREMRLAWQAEIRVGTPLLECLNDPRLREAARRSFNRALGGEVFTEIQRQPESDLSYEFTWNPIRSSDGGVQGVTVFARDISAARRADEALRASEERLRLALQAAQQGLYDLNVQTGDAVVSPEYATMLGYDPGTFIETNAAWLERLHPEDRDSVGRAYTDYIAGRTQDYRVEFRQRTRAGDWKWILSLGRIVERSPDGAPLRMLGTHTDITERKAAEAALQENEDRYRDLVDNSREVISTCDLEGNFLSVNEQAVRTSGYTREALLQMNLADLLAPATRRLFPDYLQRVRTLGEDQGIMRIQPASGEHQFWDYHSSLRTEGVAQPVVRGMALDVTERMRAERAQRASEAQLQVILESTGDGILAVDDKGKVIKANSRFAELWQVPAALLETRDDQALLDHVLAQLVEPEAFLAQVAALYRSDATSLDLLHFKDGRCFERYSAPMLAGEAISGRVWSFRDITGRVQAETEARLLSQRLDLATEAAGIGVWDWDLKTDRWYGTPTYFKMLGYPPESGFLNREVWIERIHPEDRPGVAARIQAVLGGSLEPYEYEARIRHADGGYRWVRVRGRVVEVDGDGRALRLLGARVDITDIKQVEEALRGQEARLSESQRIAHLGSWTVELPGQAMTWSEETYRIYGQAPGTTPTFTLLLSLILPEDRDRMAEWIRACLAGEAPGDLEFRIQHPERGLRTLLGRGGLVRDAGGEARNVIGTVQDITERKAVEKAIVDSHERFELANRATFNVIWDWDLNTRALWRNDNFETLFGHPAGNAGSVYESSALHIHPEDVERVLAGIQVALASTEEFWADQYRFRRADGSYATVEDRAVITRDASGRAIRMLGAMQDVTERVRAEEALRDREHLYRSLFENMLNGFAHCRMIREEGRPLDFAYLAVNRAFEAMTGLKDVVGRRISELVPGIQESDAELFAIYDRVSLGGPPVKFERYVEAMGIWFAVAVYSPRPDHFVALFDVINERKAAERALRDSEEKLRMIIEHSRQLFYTHSVDNTVTYVSPQVREFFEIGPEDSFRPWTDFLTEHPANAAGLEATARAIATGERQPPYELELRSATGRIFWVEVHESPVVEAGRTVAMVGALTDITQAKLAGERLRLQGGALEAAANAIVITGRDGIIEWANSAFTAMSGYTLAEAVGRTPGALLKSGVHDQAFYRGMWDALLAGEAWRGEIVNRRKDGGLYSEDMTITPMVNERGELTHFIAIKQDISARKEAERELLALNRSLQMLSACNEALVRAEDEQELLDVTCKVAVEFGGYRAAWVGYAQEDAGRSIALMGCAGDPTGFLKRLPLSWSEEEPAGRGPAGTAIRSGRASWWSDAALEPAALQWRGALEQWGVRGVLALPLMPRYGGKVFGVLTLYATEALHLVPKDLDLLQEMANDLAFGIENLRAQKERRQIEQAVLKMAQGVSGRAADAAAEAFFGLTVTSLIEALGAHGGLLGRLEGRGGTGAAAVRTLHLAVGGEPLANLTYALAGTPCEQVQAGETCVFEAGVQGLFPEDGMLAEFGIQAYAGTPLRDSRGQTLGLLAVFFTARIENRALVESTLRIFAARAAGELERQDSEQRLREQASLLDKAHDAILVRDMEHRVLFWNQGAERLYGWTAAEVLGRSVVELLFDRPEVFQGPQNLLLVEREWNGRIQQHRKDGSALMVEGHWTLVLDEEGRPRSVLAINTDITERVRAEEELHRYTQRLEALREIDAALLGARSASDLARGALIRLRNIVPFERAAVVLFDAAFTEGVLLAVDQDRPWRPLAGEARPIGEFHDLQELAATPFLDLPDLAEIQGCAMEHLLLSQGLRNLVYVPMESEGALLGFVALSATTPGLLTPEHAEIALDMTDQLAVALQHARLKEELERANLRLESKVEARTAELQTTVATLQVLEGELRQREAEAWAASEAKSTFLSSMSHELRTPLIGVTGMLEVLGQSDLDAQQRQVVGIIHESSESLLHIIGDILDFSKIEANKLELALQTFSVRALVDSVSNTFKSAISAKGLRFLVDVDPGIAPAHVADALRLRQILNNFMSNAVKFTEEGAITLRVRSLGGPPGRESLAFDVQDTGIGVSPEGQEKLFAPFTQAEASTTRRFGGTGLGLVISRRLADLMGGNLRMQSAVGEGTTLSLTLDLPLGHEGDIPHATRPDPLAGRPLRPAPGIEEAERERSLVLLAEDHPTNRIVITQQVNRAGFALEVAVDGQEAFERWQSGRYALILTDLHMPRMDGVQLTRAVRDWEREQGLPRTPILALTANALGGEAARCLELGMDDYLIKPVNIALLASKLHQWLPHLASAAAPVPPAGAPPDPEPGFDPALLLALCGGDGAAAKGILEEFLQATLDDLDELREALDRKDRPAVARQAHRVKGSSAMVGAGELAQRAAELEACARDDRTGWGELQGRVAGLQEALAALSRTPP